MEHSNFHIPSITFCIIMYEYRVVRWGLKWSSKRWFYTDLMRLITQEDFIEASKCSTTILYEYVP